MAIRLRKARDKVKAVKISIIKAFIDQADSNWRSRFAKYLSNWQTKKGFREHGGYSLIQHEWIGYLSRGRDGANVIPSRYTQKYLSEVASGKRKMKAMRIPINDRPSLIPNTIDSQSPLEATEFVYRYNVRRVDVPLGRWERAHKLDLLENRYNIIRKRGR